MLRFGKINAVANYFFTTKDRENTKHRHTPFVEMQGNNMHLDHEESL